MATPTRFPDTLILEPDEIIIAMDSFRYSIILFWLQSRFALTNRRVVVEYPNTVLDIIPSGYSKVVSFPLSQIASVEISPAPIKDHLIIGILILFLSVIFAREIFVTLIVLLFGFLVIISAWRAAFVVTNKGGKKVLHGLTEAQKARGFVDRVNSVMVQELS